jgi:hypothetical protein
MKVKESSFGRKTKKLNQEYKRKLSKLDKAGKRASNVKWR